MSQSVGAEMLHIASLRRVTLEFTTRCNLRCSYCALAQPHHPDRDLNLDQFDTLLGELKELGVEYVQISGAGETTVVKNWDHYLYQLVDAGFQVSIITNFAKPMSERAAEALSRCVEVTTSCDTVDPELFNAIRSRGDFRMFLHNILRIRALCLEQNRPAPRLIWNMVANDKTILGVPRWAALGLALGIDHFQISEMTKFPDVEGAFNVQPIGTLSRQELEQARAGVEQARRLIASAGKAFNILPFAEEVLAGTRKSIRQVFDLIPGPGGNLIIQGGRKWIEHRGDDGSVREEVEPPPQAAPERMTRNCILPWTEACFWAGKGVTPCCLIRGTAAFSGSGVLDVINSPGFVSIREGLLSGNLAPACHTCSMFETVEPPVLRARVKALYGESPSA
jgi:hypothetical protein